MTKTLTEQWRDGTLPTGSYYIRVKEQGEEKIIEHKISGSAFFYDQNVLLGIVAPVHSYDEYKRLVSNSDESSTEQVLNLQKMVEDECSRRCELEKKLEIATKALKEISQHYYPEYNKGGEISHKALKEMDGVK